MGDTTGKVHIKKSAIKTKINCFYYSKVINCRAAILWAQNEDLSIENIEVAPPKAKEVRVKMVATGICQSDAYYIKNGGFSSAGVFPAILGHEGSGIVESIGEGVTRFKKGICVPIL